MKSTYCAKKPIVIFPPTAGNLWPCETCDWTNCKRRAEVWCSLGVVTQRPSELDPTVLSQCSTLFAMRLANELDKGIIRAAAGVSAVSTIAFLSSIADREAIAFGEAIATPMRMKFADISARAEDQGGASGERDAHPIDSMKLSAQLRGEPLA